MNQKESNILNTDGFIHELFWLFINLFVVLLT